MVYRGHETMRTSHASGHQKQGEAHLMKCGRFDALLSPWNYAEQVLTSHSISASVEKGQYTVNRMCAHMYHISHILWQSGNTEESEEVSNLLHSESMCTGLLLIPSPRNCKDWGRIWPHTETEKEKDLCGPLQCQISHISLNISVQILFSVFTVISLVF